MKFNSGGPASWSRSTSWTRVLRASKRRWKNTLCFKIRCQRSAASWRSSDISKRRWSANALRSAASRAKRPRWWQVDSRVRPPFRHSTSSTSSRCSPNRQYFIYLITFHDANKPTVMLVTVYSDWSDKLFEQINGHFSLLEFISSLVEFHEN